MAGAGWREGWLRHQREKVVALLHELSEEGAKDLEADLLREMEDRKAHPQLVKRLQANGWDHPLVRHLMIDFYARGALGEAWDKPTTDELLDIASEVGAPSFSV